MIKLVRFICFGLLLSVMGVSYAGQVRAAQRGAADRFEVASIKAVRPTLVNAVAALRKGDVAGAKVAMADFDSGWNGVEVYISTRDMDMYNELERVLQAKVTEAVNKPDANAAAILPDAQAMLAKYDEMIANEEKAAPLNPLYDDVARLRIVRAHLREVNPALKAGDMAKARKSFDAFNDQWDSIENLIKERSIEAYTQIEGNMIQIERALGASQPDNDAVTTLVSGIMDKYNPALAAITQEARARK
jgi:hypothetical protein